MAIIDFRRSITHMTLKIGQFGPLLNAITHYEIMTLKITLKIFLTLKRYGNHTEKHLQRKSQW